MSDIKECYKKYRQSPKGKLAIKKYEQSPKGRIRNKKYRESPKGKLTMKKYRTSDIGKKIKKNENSFHGPIHNLKRNHEFILENCAICNSSENIEMHHPNPEMPLHVYFLCRTHHFEQHYTNYFSMESV